MLTRRDVHSLLLGSVAMAAGHWPISTSATGISGRHPADLYLSRLTFGATPEERAGFDYLGAEGWLDRQLTLRPEDDADLRARLSAAVLRIAYEADRDDLGNSWDALDELRPLTALTTPPEGMVKLVNYEVPMSYTERARPAEEVIAASLIRAVHAEAQLREVMTQFWHDHFNVMSTKDESTAVWFPAYDTMLRAHALGNFRAMLGEVAKSPSMLNYLGNADSRASPANENFARELLELYTLGAGNYLSGRHAHWSEVPGAADGLAEGYLDQDVFEVARAFTGWSIGDGRWVSEGVLTPMTGKFFYVEAWHDPYQKRVLGREFAPNRAPLEDGEEVLDMLAAHPGTALFVTTKIVRRLLADDPDPALVDRLAQVFIAAKDAPDQIAQVVRALVLSPEFSAPPAKLRRPFEFLAACLRASGVSVVAPETSFRWDLQRAGWRQHEFGPPTGHPDIAERWSNTTVFARLADLALYIHEDWAGYTNEDIAGRLPTSAGSFGQVWDHWAERIGVTGTASRDIYLSAMGAGEGDPLPEDPAERRTIVAMAFAIAAFGPEMLVR